MLKQQLKIYALLFALFHLSIYSSAQKYNFKNYLVVNGLASSTINSIFQDRKGYIWFATQGGGLSRFNGKDFKNFTHADGLCSNDVTCITEDYRGDIWIGTAEGASQFNGSQFTTYNQSNGLPGGVVYSIYCDSANRIWMALHDGGIRIFDGKKFDSLTTKEGLSSNEAYSITQDKHGNYWFGLSNGIAKYNQSKITDYSGSKAIKGKTFFSSMVNNDGSVWFGSTSGDVIIIRANDSIEKLELPQGLTGDFIGGICQDKKENIWLATDHGLLKYSQKQFKLFGEREGLSVNAVQAVLADYEGNIWAGTLTGGVNLLNSEAFVQYSDKDGLSNRNITAICSAPAGKTYYVGTSEGLYYFDPQSIPKFRKETGLKAIEKINISSLSPDANGDLWISAQEGIFVLEKTGSSLQLKKRYLEIAGEKITSASEVIHDSKGNTWTATFGSGIFFINGNTAKCYHTKNKFASDKILTVFEDSKSNIWIGTQDAGVIKYDGKDFHSIALNTNLNDKAVWSIAEDDNGNMFFGTGESGLRRFDGKTVTAYTSKDGLMADYVPALQWDKYDTCLWLGGEKGLEKIKIAANCSIEKLHAYSAQEGFNSSAVNQNGIWMDDNRQLWLATVNGLWLFNRLLDFAKNTSPKIQLAGVRLFYQKTDWKSIVDSVNHQTNLPENLILPYNKNHLTFDIQALTTSEVLYTFKLEGQDEQWSTPAATNAITYTNITAGKKYTFKARAVSNTGILSDKVISYPFTINPPWWNTWWFRFLLFAAVIGSLATFVKAREKLLREQNLRLEETVKQRTLEIEEQKKLVEEQNKKITIQKEVVEKSLFEKEVLLKEIHHRVKNNLQTISSMLMLQSAGLKDENAKKAIAESQSRVRSIALVHQKLYQTDGLEKVELKGFIKDLAEQVKYLFSEKAKQISLHLEVPETFVLIDTAIPLGLILNELLTNSLKYAFTNTQHGEIKIRVDYIERNNNEDNWPSNRRRVRLSYRDSGPGLPSGQILENTTTLGLKLVKLLSQQIGTGAEYSNSNGSEFIFTFKISI